MVAVQFLTLLATFGLSAAAQQNGEWPFDLTTLKAPDGSIVANFVSIGATLTELFVKDRRGKFQDVVLGYDDHSKLWSDPDHPVFNAMVGRYANRIKNGTFSIPITKYPQPPGPNVYNIPTNDHNGEVTLHGGLIGWDRRNWTIVARTPTSVTYKHVDKEHEGFPGTVTAFAQHTVANGGILNTRVFAKATEKTPIMLTQHIYWNLNAFQANASTMLDHKLNIAASKVIKLDGNAIPTGEFIDVNRETIFDFRRTRVIGDRWNETTNMCGPPCSGYDHCYVYDRDVSRLAGTSLWSDITGIRVDMTTNQPAVQMYTAHWLNTPRKAAHGGPTLKYGSYAAVALEQQGHVDAINTPEWNVDQIYGPLRDYVWDTTYKFSTF